MFSEYCCRHEKLCGNGRLSVKAAIEVGSLYGNPAISRDIHGSVPVTKVSLILKELSEFGKGSIPSRGPAMTTPPLAGRTLR
jgi:hypothetical protein